MRAAVVGAGPNGLAAAITLAEAGLEVEVFEAEALPGGGARTMELTLPGFWHDFGSAVHPMGVGSPFLSRLPLERFGLEWIYSPAAVAHPLDDGSAALMVVDIREQEPLLGSDGATWRRVFSPFARRWSDLAEDVLQPISLLPKHPLLMARFGALALPAATAVARTLFRQERTRALFAGMAAHSFLRLDRPLSAAFAMIFGSVGHSVGWPIPRGGSQAITTALIGYLGSLGGSVRTESRVESLDQLSGFDLVMCDTSPRQLLQLGAGRLSSVYRRKFAEFQQGPGAFKVDYAMSEPIPWKAQECRDAITVHVGGRMEEIAASEAVMSEGGHAERPFLLVAQPTLFDAARAPAGRHIAWVYCHVPNGSTFDMLPRIEAQLERFAPGFRDCVLARRVLSPAGLQAMDANLIGGDVNGGAADLMQFAFRPTWRYYATSDPKLYLCSASTPPGGGVHGMCGYNAARMALRKLRV